MDLKELMSAAEDRIYSESLALRHTIMEGVYNAIENSRREIEAQLDVENFRTNIMAMPEKIRIQQEVYKETRTAFEAAKSDLVNIESMLMAVITAEMNGAGKPAFSNDTSRRAELEIRKKTDFDYSMAWDPYKAALDEMENAQFKLEQLSNEFKAYQTVGGLLAARLSLMRLEV